MNSCELACGCWESNLGPLQEKQVPLAVDLSFQTILLLWDNTWQRQLRQGKRLFPVYTSRSQLIIKGGHGFLIESTHAFSYIVHVCLFLHSPCVPFLMWPMHAFSYTGHMCLLLYSPCVPLLTWPMRAFSGNSTTHSEQSPLTSVKIHDNLPSCTHSTTSPGPSINGDSISGGLQAVSI